MTSHGDEVGHVLAMELVATYWGASLHQHDVRCMFSCEDVELWRS